MLEKILAAWAKGYAVCIKPQAGDTGNFEVCVYRHATGDWVSMDLVANAVDHFVADYGKPSTYPADSPEYAKMDLEAETETEE